MGLTRALDALGIQQALVYHGVNTSETYEPMGFVIKRIAENIHERLERMKQRRAP